MQVTSVLRLQPGWLLRGFRIVLVVVVTLASSCGGGDVTGPTPSVPTSLTISPQAVTLSWIGEPAQLSVEVRDQNGNVMAGQAVAWSSTNPAVATVAAGGLVIATGAGQAAVSASSGSASQAVPVSVTLVPHSMIKVAGDAQRGTVGSPLLDSLVAEVRDQGGTPIEGAAVSWSVLSGGGAITSSQDRTDRRRSYLRSVDSGGYRGEPGGHGAIGATRHRIHGRSDAGASGFDGSVLGEYTGEGVYRVFGRRRRR